MQLLEPITTAMFSVRTAKGSLMIGRQKGIFLFVPNFINSKNRKGPVRKLQKEETR